jgi:hypothetical protein
MSLEIFTGEDRKLKKIFHATAPRLPAYRFELTDIKYDRFIRAKSMHEQRESCGQLITGGKIEKLPRKNGQHWQRRI